VHALGVVGQRPRASFLQALVRDIRTRIDTECSPQGLCMIVYGLMRLQIREERVLNMIIKYMLENGLEQWSPLTTCILCYAFAKLKYESNESIWATCGSHIKAHYKDLEPKALTMALYSFALASEQSEEARRIMPELINGITGRIATFDHRQFTTFCFAVGRFRLFSPMESQQSTFKKDPWAELLWNEAKVRKWETFSMTEANLITYSLMRLCFRDDDFLKSIGETFPKRAIELTTTELINVLYACAKLDFLHIELVKSVLEEIKRRDLLAEMSELNLATLSYSLALMRIRVDWVMDEVAIQMCKRIQYFKPQSIHMAVWSLAVLDCNKHAEALACVVLEDIRRRLNDFPMSTVCCVLWAISIIAGSSSTIKLLNILLDERLKQRSVDMEQEAYCMLYLAYASLYVESGINVDQISGWYLCRQLYETTVLQSQQNKRLSDLMKISRVPHKANEMVPALDGQRDPCVVGDIVLESLQIVIEVEGPHRMFLPFEELVAEIEIQKKAEVARIENKKKTDKKSGDEEKSGDEDDTYTPPEEFAGSPEEVLGEARELMECQLTGTAQFKRRLLRQSGWTCITVSFDENEEYIVDALSSMKKKKEEGPMEVKESSDDDDDDAESAIQEGEKYEDILRDRLAQANKELQRRIAKEGTNAAGAVKFKNQIEYLNWQVQVEKEITQEMFVGL